MSEWWHYLIPFYGQFLVWRKIINFFTLDKKEKTAIILGVVGVISLIGIGVYVYARKKKEELIKIAKENPELLRMVV